MSFSPSAVALGIRSWFLRGGSRRAMLVATFLSLIGATMVVVLAMRPAQTLPKVTLNWTNAPFGATCMLAVSRGFFKEAGVDVRLRGWPTGKDALANLIDGQADFATAAETPIMFTMLKTTTLKIIATLAVSTDNNTLVVRKDSGIASSNDLPGHRVGFLPGTTSQHFLDTFLEYRAMKADCIERIPLKADEIVKALTDGKVDAISIWTPFNRKALAELGANGQELRMGSAYRWGWRLVARNEEIATGPMAPLIISALARASQALREDPQGCARELAQELGMTEGDLVEVWTRTMFEVNLDQALILNLEQQARWAISSGLTEEKEVPNFLPGISSQAMRQVDAAAVTLIDGKGRL